MTTPHASTPAHQLRLAILALVGRTMTALDAEVASALRGALPVLALYEQQATRRWPTEALRTAEIGGLEADHPDWPFQRLALLPDVPCAVEVVTALLMVEDDPDLAHLIEPEGSFPTAGGLLALHRLLHPSDDGAALPETLAGLVCAGILVEVDPEAMRARQRYRVAPHVAALFGGLTPHGQALRLTPAHGLPAADEWISHRNGDAAPAAQGLLWRRKSVDVRLCDAGEWRDAKDHARDEARIVIVRGPARNGRKTWARMAAASASRSLLQAGQAVLADPAAWRTASAMAWLADAVLMLEIDGVPGETVEIPLPCCGPLDMVIVTGSSGAVRAPQGHATSHVRLRAPDPAARRRHWAASGIALPSTLLDPIQVTSGNIRRAAADARANAQIAGRENVDVANLRAALQGLRDARLEALATRIDGSTALPALSLDAESDEEFAAIVTRCRHREALAGEHDGSTGVRVLFSGPSGTGKTLAARHVAEALSKDIYRIDLSATVNKYIGETEKALERALSAAEELDVVLLLDEGDALMARRTDVGNANDRYANLETNFLLQRIESFAGVLVVTSNDAERIDGAFSRRMDAVIAFSQPDELRREEILVRHLGKDAKVSTGLIAEIATRCALSGGQIANLVRHARLLAFDGGRPLGDPQLRAAVEREYRKAGGNCPLRRAFAAVG